MGEYPWNVLKIAVIGVKTKTHPTILTGSQGILLAKNFEPHRLIGFQCKDATAADYSGVEAAIRQNVQVTYVNVNGI